MTKWSLRLLKILEYLFLLTAAYYFDTGTAVQAQELAGFHTKKEHWKYIQMMTDQITENDEIQFANESSWSMVRTALKVYKNVQGWQQSRHWNKTDSWSKQLSKLKLQPNQWIPRTCCNFHQFCGNIIS